MKNKRTHLRGEIRAVAEDGTIEILAVAYGITDDYGTQFQRGTFTESLEQRLPVIAWGHDWSEPIGRALDYRETDEGLYLTARLDIGQGIARADQAHTQLRSGTLTDVSVGFMRVASEDNGDHVMITKAELDEVSVVLRGAVPGARVLAVRSARSGEVVDLGAVEEIARRVVAGDIDQATADEMARLLSAPPAEGDPLPTPAEDVVTYAEPEPEPVTDELAADVIAEAEQILDRSR